MYVQFTVHTLHSSHPPPLTPLPLHRTTQSIMMSAAHIAVTYVRLVKQVDLIIGNYVGILGPLLMISDRLSTAYCYQLLVVSQEIGQCVQERATSDGNH